MIVLAIDIGETTGYAYVSDGQLLHYGTCALGAHMPEKFKPDLVVIERPAFVPNKMQEQYSKAVAALIMQYGAKKTRMARPADWMPQFNRHPLPERGVLATQHEKDAYRMAVWALHKYKKES
jgi:hypothetical protein